MSNSTETAVVDAQTAVESDRQGSAVTPGDVSWVVDVLKAPEPEAVPLLAKEDISGFSVEKLLDRADQALGASQLLRRLSGEQYLLACQAWAIAREKAAHGTWNRLIESRGLKASTVRQAVQVYRALPDIEMVRGLTITQIKEKGGLVKPRAVADQAAFEKLVAKKPVAEGEDGVVIDREAMDAVPQVVPQHDADTSAVVTSPPEPVGIVEDVQPDTPPMPPKAPTSKEMLTKVVRALEEVGQVGGLDSEVLELLDRASDLLQSLRQSVARRDAA